MDELIEWLQEWLEGSVAAYAAIVATGALFLEVRRWMESGVRLSISVMPEAKMFGGYQEDLNTYLALTVTNRGEAPTTLTHVALFNYATFWHWLRRKPKNTAIVKNPGHQSGQHIPYLLEPGKMFHGLVNHDPQLKDWIDGGWLFVGVIGSHADKPKLIRVRKPNPIKTDEPAK